MEHKFFSYRCQKATPGYGTFLAYYTVDQSRPGAVLVAGEFNVGDEITLAFPATQNYSELMNDG